MLPDKAFNELTRAYQLSPRCYNRMEMTYGGYEAKGIKGSATCSHMWSTLQCLKNMEKAKTEDERYDCITSYWSADETIEEFKGFFHNQGVSERLKALIGGDVENRVVVGR